MVTFICIMFVLGQIKIFFFFFFFYIAPNPYLYHDKGNIHSGVCPDTYIVADVCLDRLETMQVYWYVDEMA